MAIIVNGECSWKINARRKGRRREWQEQAFLEIMAIENAMTSGGGGKYSEEKVRRQIGEGGENRDGEGEEKKT